DEWLELAALRSLGQLADERVPQSPAQWVCELGGLVDAERHLQYGLDPGATHRLVAGKRGGGVVAPRKAVGGDDRILGRPCRSLPDSRGCRVRGVTDKDKTALAPAGERPQVVDVVAQHRDLLGRPDDRCDRFVPAREAPDYLCLAPLGFIGLAFRRVLRREPV